MSNLTTLTTLRNGLRSPFALQLSHVHARLHDEGYDGTMAARLALSLGLCPAVVFGFLRLGTSPGALRLDVHRCTNGEVVGADAAEKILDRFDASTDIREVPVAQVKVWDALYGLIPEAVPVRAHLRRKEYTKAKHLAQAAKTQVDGFAGIFLEALAVTAERLEFHTAYKTTALPAGPGSLVERIRDCLTDTLQLRVAPETSILLGFIAHTCSSIMIRTWGYSAVSPFAQLSLDDSRILVITTALAASAGLDVTTLSTWIDVVALAPHVPMTVAEDHSFRDIDWAKQSHYTLSPAQIRRRLAYPVQFASRVAGLPETEIASALKGLAPSARLAAKQYGTLN